MKDFIQKMIASCKGLSDLFASSEEVDDDLVFEEKIDVDLHTKGYASKVEEGNTVRGTSVELGVLLSYDAKQVKRLMNAWCFCIDEKIDLDIITNKVPTKFSKKLFSLRGFTFREYLELFNPHIAEEDFVNYAAFEFLNIQTEKQRFDFTCLHSGDADDYIESLLFSPVREILSFFFDKFFPYKVPLKALFQSSSIIAPPGTGKTFLMRTWLYRLIEQFPQFSFVIIDPHGDISKKLYESKICTKDRFIYLDVGFINRGHIFSYNVLGIKDDSPLTRDSTRGQIADAILELVSDDDKMSTSTHSVLDECLNFLFQRVGSTLQDLYNLVLLEPTILKEAQAWNPYFNDAKFVKGEARSRDALERRLRFMKSDIGRRMLSEADSFDLEGAINSNKVVIVNLQGISPDAKQTIGKFMLANIKSYVAKRDPDSEFLRHTIVAVDEAHNFVSGSYEFMLEQLRKYGLHMMLANQYLEQLGGNMISVKKNTAIKVFAGESTSDVKGFVDVPRIFLKDRKSDKDGVNDLDLNDYEFLIKIRNMPMRKISPPTFLLNEKKYKKTKEEIEDMDKFQLESYYRPFNFVKKTKEQTEVSFDLDIPDNTPIVPSKDKTLNIRVAKKDDNPT